MGTEGSFASAYRKAALKKAISIPQSASLTAPFTQGSREARAAKINLLLLRRRGTAAPAGLKAAVEEGSEPFAAGDFDHPVNGRKGEERAASERREAQSAPGVAISARKCFWSAVERGICSPKENDLI